jgi:hypothetical protein
VDRHDVRGSRVNPGLLQDWHEHVSVVLEGLLRIPDLVDHEVAVGPEAGVMNPARRMPGSGGLEFPNSFVVLLCAQGLGWK